jgi:hypothetical protein
MISIFVRTPIVRMPSGSTSLANMSASEVFKSEGNERNQEN